MKTIINSQNAPLPIGPYNQAVLAGNTLYVSGQIAIHPESNLLVVENIKLETKQVMENLKAILNAANMTFYHVVKSTIYIKNMDDFSCINTIYATYFDQKTAPSRETVEVSKLPKNVNVEISMIAVK